MLDRPQQLAEQILSTCQGKDIWVAYSGGVDSHVLLHLLATQLDTKSSTIKAIHIDHGLHSESSKWTQHCLAIAEKLNIVCQDIKADVNNIESVGVEAAAREARYTAIAQYLPENALLLTAQHQQDQSETFLLQLLRGAGPKGLSSMASQSTLMGIQLYRPFLAISKKEILAYAKQHQLNWLDDPSNVETRWNRNYIRHEIWPVIEQRWSSAAKTISRSATLCAEADELMTELAKLDALTIDFEQQSFSLSVSKLLGLTESRRRNVLRHLISTLALPLPSANVLQRVINEACLAKEDGIPLVEWQGVEVRRYRNRLYIKAPMNSFDVSFSLQINDRHELAIGEGKILAWKTSQQGLTDDIIQEGLQLRFRQGGEKIKIHGQHHSLKHLMQEWAVPPWQRDRIPLLFCEDELLVVVGYALSDAVSGTKQQRYIPIIKQA